MRIAFCALVTCATGGAALVFAPHPAGSVVAAAVFLLFLILLTRGIASVRSSLVEPTIWRSGDPADTQVALTFDDGPHPEWTARVLDVLRAHGAHATFFVIGENVRRHPGLVRRIVDEGHDVGCHADSHAPRTALFRRARMEREIADCRAAVHAEAGVTPRLYRPPFGLRSPAHVGMAHALDLVTVGMARRGHDKRAGREPGELADAVVTAARPGEILALHDGDEPGRVRDACTAVDALPAILTGLASRGLHATSVSALLAERPYVESPARAWSGRVHGGHFGNRVFMRLAARAGAGPALLLLALVAAWFTVFKPEARRASLQLLERVHGRRGPLRRLAWVYQHFFVYGRTLLWRLQLVMNAREPADIEHVGLDSIRAALARPGPVLLVSAHLGDWSAASRRLRELGGRRLSVIAFRGVGLGPHQVDERGGGSQQRLIDVAEAPQDVAFAIAAALAEGDAVAIHADRSLRTEQGIAVPFLGADARFPGGVWRMALTTGVPAIVYFAIPTSIDRVVLHCYGPIHVARVPREQRADAVRAAAAEFADHLGDCVRRHPLHWGNFYDFWKAP